MLLLLRSDDLAAVIEQDEPRARCSLIQRTDEFFPCGALSFSSFVFAEDEDGVVAAEAEGLGEAGPDGVGVHLGDEIQILHGMVEIPAHMGGLWRMLRAVTKASMAPEAPRVWPMRDLVELMRNVFPEDLFNDCGLRLVIQTGPGSMGIDVIDFRC